MKKTNTSIRTIDSTPATERVRTTHVRAPQLRRVLDALMALELDPNDRRAKVTVGLLEKQGALQCPACEKRLSIDGFRETRTHYGSRQTLCCRACRTGFVVSETQIV